MESQEHATPAGRVLRLAAPVPCSDTWMALALQGPLHAPPLRVAIAGCGQIADAHLQEIAKLDSGRVVAVCDMNPDLTRQAAERFGIEQQFTDFAEMLVRVRPDVVHILTPVHTHRPLAIQALQSGVHAYVEKPFTLDRAEADEVLAVAEAEQRLVCLGHDQLFDPAWRECRELCTRGVIGTVQHVESVLGYPINGPFGRLVMADPNHWVRRLPGGLFQNTISHPLYRITDFLLDSEPDVWATWFSRDHDTALPTEMRVQLRGETVTGSLTFTSTVRPFQRVTRVYGTEGILEVDLDWQSIRLLQTTALPGALGKMEAAWRQWQDARRHAGRILHKFMRSELHYFAGMKCLFDLFHQAIQQSLESPIPYAECRRVTSLMDRIFESCRKNEHVSFESPSRRDLITRSVDDISTDLTEECIAEHASFGTEITSVN